LSEADSTFHRNLLYILGPAWAANLAMSMMVVTPRYPAPDETIPVPPGAAVSGEIRTHDFRQPSARRAASA